MVCSEAIHGLAAQDMMEYEAIHIPILDRLERFFKDDGAAMPVAIDQRKVTMGLSWLVCGLDQGKGWG